MNAFSKFGFVLATLGSSIGLGHIWRFPYMAGENGGGAFVLFYIFLAIAIGAPILTAKMLIGNIGRANAPRSYENCERLDKGEHAKNAKKWRWAGVTIYGGPLILTFYAVVLGWVFYYLFVVSFNLPTTYEAAKDSFGTLMKDSLIAQSAGFLLTMGVTAWVVARGAKEGIEKLNFIMMPLLFVIFIGLLGYAASMPAFKESAHFMFDLDFSKLTPGVMLDSMGQVFFSLSLGVGTIITYASYAPKGDNLLSSSLWVVLSGIVVSLIAGLMIFTFIFEFGGEPGAGPGLLLVSLPLVFGQMNELSGWGLGTLISTLFFSAIIFAGITSTISILEPAALYWHQRFKVSKARASYSVSAGIVAVGMLVILSLHDLTARDLAFFGKSLFDILDFFTSSLVMPLGALVGIIFVGWNLKRESVRKWAGFLGDGAFFVWYFIVKFIAPVVIVAILVSKLFEL